MSEIHLEICPLKKKNPPGINLLFCQFSPILSLAQKYLSSQFLEPHL